MSTTNIGINGFGRVGRQVLRASVASSDLRVVAINDPFLDAEAAANAIRFDSAAGRFRGTVEVRGKNVLVVDGRRIAFTAITDPAQVPWSEHSVQYVLECSGVYTTAERASSHLAGGAQRVIIGTVSADAPTVVLGANEEAFKPTMQVVAAGSAVSVALSPVLRALNAGFGGVESATFTCLHAASAGRATDSTNSKDPRGARAALTNFAPVAMAQDVKTVGRVLPRLAGRVTGSTIRVPVAVGSMLDVVVTLAEPTSLAKVAEVLENVTCARVAPGSSAAQPASAAVTPARGTTGEQGGSPTSAAAGGASPAPQRPPAANASVQILGVTRDPVVSGDFAGEDRSAVLDVKASIAVPSVSAATSPSAPGSTSITGSAPEDAADCRTFKLVLWFDNERGYAQRLLDLVSYTCSAW